MQTVLLAAFSILFVFSIIVLVWKALENIGNDIEEVVNKSKSVTRIDMFDDIEKPRKEKKKKSKKGKSWIPSRDMDYVMKGKVTDPFD